MSAHHGRILLVIRDTDEARPLAASIADLSASDVTEVHDLRLARGLAARGAWRAIIYDPRLGRSSTPEWPADIPVFAIRPEADAAGATALTSPDGELLGHLLGVRLFRLQAA